QYDFTMFGNTMNPSENPNGCITGTVSSADLTLDPGQDIIAAYLYWSGSGSLDFADLEVELNGVPLIAERVFESPMGGANLMFFGAFVDVTTFIQTTGNGTYTLSELDISEALNNNPDYCNGGTNYAGWAVVVVYEDTSLPNNIVSIFDGFNRVDSNNQELNFTLGGLNVIDPAGAKIGFLAWEGDAGIAVNETLRANGNILSNPPLNPANNAFNGTNSFT